MFSEKLLELHSMTICIWAFLSFCFLSSSVYILNDLIDFENDKKHPRKKYRPIPSGLISKKTAVIAAIILCTSGLGLAFYINTYFITVSLLYIFNNIAYSFVLKEKVVADVISISIGFVLRFLGGAYAVDVETSRWFLICTFSLSLFLGLGKRRAEIEMLGKNAVNTRAVLRKYTKEKVDSALACACAMTLVTYMLFATDSGTFEKHHSDKFIYTVPIVAYCVIRYMFRVQEGDGDGPVEILLKDKGFIIAGICWIVMSMFIVYYF